MVDAGSVPEPAPVKSLSDRVAYAHNPDSGSKSPLTKYSANPKGQPKSAVTKANAKDAGKGGPAGRRGAKQTRAPKNPRPKAKTAEELDAEMTDYFAGNGANAGNAQVNAAAANGAEPTANTEDLGMEEISVDYIDIIT